MSPCVWFSIKVVMFAAALQMSLVGWGILKPKTKSGGKFDKELGKFDSDDQARKNKINRVAGPIMAIVFLIWAVADLVTLLR